MSFYQIIAVMFANLIWKLSLDFARLIVMERVHVNVPPHIKFDDVWRAKRLLIFHADRLSESIYSSRATHYIVIDFPTG